MNLLVLSILLEFIAGEISYARDGRVGARARDGMVRARYQAEMRPGERHAGKHS